MEATTPFDWTQYATSGALRPDSFSGMQPGFNSALEQMFMSAPPEIRQELMVSSGYRSPERQAELWAAALQKYGSAEAARKWVAPPGNSQHNHGNAADMSFASDAARAWVHANAQQYGLAFPLSNEPWHIELATARGGAGMPQTPYAGPAGATANSLPQAMPPNSLMPQPQPVNQLAQFRLPTIDPATFSRNRLRA